MNNPTYVLKEALLIKNLSIIQKVSQEANIQIILAFKAFALWKTFPLFRKYITATTASSLNEARLAHEEFGAPAHTYSPAYLDSEIDMIARMSSHLTFNSLSQYRRLAKRAKKANEKLQIGLRVNPEYSEIATDLYNPCSPGTRFGVTADELFKAYDPSDIEIPPITGLHMHCHCENDADVFVRTLAHLEEKFLVSSPITQNISWINFGGGHLMTRKGYDLQLLIDTLNGFHQRYPHIKLIMEPGSAFAWQTGHLEAHVIDIVENHNIRTAILDVSFTCHMPDCLEMPYFPEVRGARHTEQNSEKAYRLGGNSCLSGDYLGYWEFDEPLSVGDTIIFEDMIHYTTVKTTMFNGIQHPDIAIKRLDGSIHTLRHYTYEDYKGRMD